MQNQAHFSNILVIPLIYKPRVNNNSKYARLFTLLHFQLIIQSPFTRTKRYTLFAQTWPGPISLSLPFLHFPPDQSTAGVHEERRSILRSDRTSLTKDQSLEDHGLKREEPDLFHDLYYAYLSPVRSHSADRKGRTTEFRRCYPNCNNEGAGRLRQYIYLRRRGSTKFVEV